MKNKINIILIFGLMVAFSFLSMNIDVHYYLWRDGRVNLIEPNKITAFLEFFLCVIGSIIIFIELFKQIYKLFLWLRGREIP